MCTPIALGECIIAFNLLTIVSAHSCITKKEIREAHLLPKAIIACLGASVLGRWLQ